MMSTLFSELTVLMVAFLKRFSEHVKFSLKIRTFEKCIFGTSTINSVFKNQCFDCFCFSNE